MPGLVNADTGRSVRWVMLELAPFGVSGAMVGAIGAVLAVRRSFVPAAAVMTIEPILKSILVVVFGSRIGINALVLGNVAGSLLTVGALWWWLQRAGVRLRVGRIHDRSFVAGVFVVGAPLLVSQSVLQTNPIVDRSMAGALSPGSVTALEIGLRICLVPTALLTGLMISPITATWAERKLRGGWPALQRSLSQAIVGIVTIAPPIVVIGLVLRGEIVRVAYQGGAYSHSALTHTISVFGMTLLVLPAQLLAMAISSVFIVEGKTLFPMLIGIANLLLNVALNFAFRPIWGVAGIALSTTVTVTLLTLVYALEAHRRWSLFRLRPYISRLALSLVATCASGGLALLVRGALPDGSTRATAILVLGAAGGAAVVLYAALSFVGDRLHVSIWARATAGGRA
jgi:putative peptidoglycan lipid II flippase